MRSERLDCQINRRVTNEYGATKQCAALLSHLVDNTTLLRAERSKIAWQSARAAYDSLKQRRPILGEARLEAAMAVPARSWRLFWKGHVGDEIVQLNPAGARRARIGEWQLIRRVQQDLEPRIERLLHFHLTIDEGATEQ